MLLDRIRSRTQRGAHSESVLERHFSLPPESGRRLVALAPEEPARSIDPNESTSLLQQSYELEPGYLAAANAKAAGKAAGSS